MPIARLARGFRGQLLQLRAFWHRLVSRNAWCDLAPSRRYRGVCAEITRARCLEPTSAQPSM
eukprot:15119571-Alexandrium_andersonii.AAC.1